LRNILARSAAFSEAVGFDGWTMTTYTGVGATGAELALLTRQRLRLSVRNSFFITRSLRS
jgi:hypothetical protein